MTNKKTILITVGVLITIGIISAVSLYFLSSQAASSNKNSSELSYSFGVHPSSMDDYTYAKDLGIDFNREGMYFIWEWSDINKDGHFGFKGATAPPHPNRPNSGRTINYDNERERLAKAGITMMGNVCPFRGGSALKGEFRNAKEQAIYQEFVEKLVERYDGDSDLGCTQNPPDCYTPGDGEYPSQSFINALQANPIKYWQVCNQVTDTCSGRKCKDNNNYAVKYAKVQELTYLGVKASCPECQVLIAGDSHKELYPPAEAQQAQGLLKRYVVAFGEGVEKVLWAWGIVEGFGCDCCIFDYTGLIYDGNREPQTCDDNDPYDRGAGVKKLSYYSFKLMIDKISGFTIVETVHDSGNYVYKFTKSNKPVYVAWNDNGGSITLTSIGSGSVKITEAVPKADSGADLNENYYPNFFTVKTKSVSGGSVTINLSNTPVFIEGQ
jgi:hypothetical protein